MISASFPLELFCPRLEIFHHFLEILRGEDQTDEYSSYAKYVGARLSGAILFTCFIGLPRRASDFCHVE